MDKAPTPLASLAIGYAAGLLTGGLAASVYFLSKQAESTKEGPVYSKELDALEKQFHLSPLKLQQLL